MLLPTDADHSTAETFRLRWRLPSDLSRTHCSVLADVVNDGKEAMLNVPGCFVVALDGTIA